MDFTIIKDTYFSIEHCYSCAVPGYLMVSPTIDTESIDGLPAPFQAQLGYSLALANRLIREVVRPIRIYNAQFGEEDKQLHFHIFPRTQELTRAFLATFPAQKDLVHGPVLLDWARTEYKCDKQQVWPVVSSVILEMKAQITST